MNEPKEKSYIVTEIEFDYDDGNNMESYPISYDEQVANRDSALGVWYAFDEEHLIDKISDTIGWCISSIDFTTDLIHPLTSIK